MLAEAARDPRRRAGPRVWYLRGGGAALAACAVALLLYLVLARPVNDAPKFFRRVQASLLVVTSLLVFLQLLTERAHRLRLLRVLAGAAYFVAILASANLLHDEMLARGTAVALPPKAVSVALQTIVCALSSAVIGLSLAAVVSSVVPGPGEPAAAGRYDEPLSVALSLRAIVALGVVGMLALAQQRAILGGGLAPWAFSRWLIGLAAPAGLLWLAAHRRSVGRPGRFRELAAATALLLVLGEMLALLLVRRTGLPF
jgi:hypothetical protein